MHILRENKKLKIDNTEISFMEIVNKLDEEFREVVEAIINYKRDKTLNNFPNL